MQKNKAVFLDADGVLNKPVLNAVGKPEAPRTLDEYFFYPDTKTSLDKLKAAGFKLICVTNKPDVAEGRMTQENLDAILKKMRTSLPLDDIFACYVRNSDCYKPKPQMIFDAAKKYNIDLKQSFMIGDTAHDVGAGQNAGCRTIWINRNYPNAKPPSPDADYTANSLTDAVSWVLKNK